MWRAFAGERPTRPLGIVRRLTSRYDATNRSVNAGAENSWNGNSGIPPPPMLVDAVVLVLEVIVLVGVEVVVVVLVELDVVELV